MLEMVALHLQKEAVSKKMDGNAADLFGRSAFNRYYYATFLRARSMLVTLDSRWGREPHKSYPDLLKGKIRQRFKNEAKKAVKIQDYELIKACKRAENACHELAEMFVKSYSIRVVADYEPSERIEFTFDGRFELRGVDINTAHRWPERAEAFCGDIEKTWVKF